MFSIPNTSTLAVMSGERVENQGEVTQESEGDAPSRPAAAVPETRYTVESEISRGGLGRVMRGHDHNLDRVVAIKQLVMHNARFEQRFQREARITARLQHPGVVPIYETGQLPGGESFYAMKLVSGHTLGEELARATTLDDRLAMIPKLIAMCDAVAYAHSERVIHRDLKPDNVMVGPFGEVLVVDWGLAKDLAVTDPPEPAELESPSGKAGLTVVGSVLGTPPYLAPEQARGESVDARADVYSLGAILYQALAGIPPHITKPSASTAVTHDASTASVHARGSADGAALLARLRAGEPIALGEHEPGTPRELVAIVEQAMARDPAERYADAAALVADLRRFQTGQLVAAHSYSRAMLIRRWLRRRRAMVTASLVALVAIAVVAMVSISRIVDERDHAREAEQQANTASARARSETIAKELRTSELVLALARHWLDLEPTATLAWLKQYAQGPSADANEIRALAIDAVGRVASVDVVRGLLAIAFAEDGTLVGYDAQLRVAT
jgi:eukaryotic-like serine/threonine-protein kinase